MINKSRRYFKKIYKKMSSKEKKLLEVLKFLIIFNLLAIPLHLIITYEFTVYPLAFIERAQVSLFLNVFGVKHAIYDVPYNEGLIPAIDINNQVLAIGEPCTSIRSLMAFTALVIASPKKAWASKKKALLYLPIIYLVNIVRIITLAFVSFEFPNIFELIHVILWREGMIALILVLWINWFRQEERNYLIHDVNY